MANVFLGLLTCCLGCNGQHDRPINVPSSAVWVDGTFINCSVEAQSKSNRCTVYRASSGEILADGSYVLNTSLREAASSDLRYAAFGNRIIYLADARKLIPWEPSERDPINRLVNEELSTLAAGKAGEVIDCQKNATGRGYDERSECAIQSFAEHKPFFVRYYTQGVDSVGSHGIAGDANGNVFVVDYDSLGWTGYHLPSDAKLLNDNHIVVLPCPKPVTFRKISIRLTCADPISGGPRM
jgi:hypothetical protein